MKIQLADQHGKNLTTVEVPEAILMSYIEVVVYRGRIFVGPQPQFGNGLPLYIEKQAYAVPPES